MKTGYVVGRVWATKRLGELPSGALLEIDLEDASGGGKGGGERLVAFDPLGCGEGERVLVTQGSVAKGWFPDGSAVVDALVVGSLDPTGETAGKGKTSPKSKARKA
ncbi:MAG: EutN/CcmL family microcompartment protein [Kiloniellales bacterium]|nr:EutN/CcmL family microcompartment protein [Kiloniellales bacterium]